MAMLPNSVDRCAQFCREMGWPGKLDFHDCPTPYGEIVFYMKGPPGKFKATVDQWQAWNRSKGWEDM